VSSTRHGPSQLNVLHLAVEAFTARDGARCWLISLLPTPPAFDAPIRRGSRRNIAMTFGREKLEWFGYQKMKKIEGTITRFDRMYERDRQTDRRTDTT